MDRRSRVSDTFSSNINLGGNLANPYYAKHQKRFMSPQMN
jgi:hypothetical protein